MTEEHHEDVHLTIHDRHSEGFLTLDSDHAGNVYVLPSNGGPYQIWEHITIFYSSFPISYFKNKATGRYLTATSWPDQYVQTSNNGGRTDESGWLVSGSSLPYDVTSRIRSNKWTDWYLSIGDFKGFGGEHTRNYLALRNFSAEQASYDWHLYEDTK